MFSIESVMSKELVTIRPGGSLADARELMRSNRIHHLPVVNDGGTLVGLVTLTDCLRPQIPFCAATPSASMPMKYVEDVMVTDLGNN